MDRRQNSPSLPTAGLEADLTDMVQPNEFLILDLLKNDQLGSNNDPLRGITYGQPGQDAIPGMDTIQDPGQSTETAGSTDQSWLNFLSEYALRELEQPLESNSPHTNMGYSAQTGVQQPISSTFNATSNFPSGEPWKNNTANLGAPSMNGPINATSNFPNGGPWNHDTTSLGPTSMNGLFQPNNYVPQPMTYAPALASVGTGRWPYPPTVTNGGPVIPQAQQQLQPADLGPVIPKAQHRLQPVDLKPTKPKEVDKKGWIRPNKATEGKNLRSAKIEAFKPELVYDPIPARPQPWGYFQYTDYGELEEAQSYSVSQMYHYLYMHPLNVPDQSGNRRLRIWIQRLPADSARRYPTATSSRCRFAECPARGRKIRPGHFRVCFDEQSWTGGNHDPFINAGYVHLFCIERLMAFPQIVHDLNVLPDERILPYEFNEKNLMSLQVSSCHTGVLTSVKEFIQASRHGHLTVLIDNWRASLRKKGLNVQINGTLNQVLQIKKLLQELSLPGKFKTKEERTAARYRFIEGHHLGDLLKIREGKPRKRRKRRRAADHDSDSDDEQEEEWFEEQPSSRPTKVRKTSQNKERDVIVIEDDDPQVPGKHPAPPSGERRYNLRSTRNTLLQETISAPLLGERKRYNLRSTSRTQSRQAQSVPLLVEGKRYNLRSTSRSQTREAKSVPLLGEGRSSHSSKGRTTPPSRPPPARTTEVFDTIRVAPPARRHSPTHTPPQSTERREGNSENGKESDSSLPRQEDDTDLDGLFEEDPNYDPNDDLDRFFEQNPPPDLNFDSDL